LSAFLDTNILLYSIATAAAEQARTKIAISILDAGDCRISVQVLFEFYAQATRPTKAHFVCHEDALELVGAFRRFPVVENTLALFDSAMRIREQTGYSVWDAAIVAAALEAGCDTLYSEDMQHGRAFGGLRIVDPFR
jgi:predicted nucleic acid-binding protein